MDAFEHEFLLPANAKKTASEDIVEQAAKIHAELLLIHPFREGNGRTARIFANLMFRRSKKEPPDWTKLDSDKYGQYVLGVQQATSKHYDLMIKLFRDLL